MLWKGGERRRWLFDHAQDVAFLHDQEVLTVDLDLGARPLAEQDLVALLDVEGLDLAAVIAGAGTDGDDFAFLRLFLGGVGNDDPALGLFFFFDKLTFEGLEAPYLLYGGTF